MERSGIQGAHLYFEFRCAHAVPCIPLRCIQSTKLALANRHWSNNANRQLLSFRLLQLP
jgi:hypothetical protein